MLGELMPLVTMTCDAEIIISSPILTYYHLITIIINSIDP